LAYVIIKTAGTKESPEEKTSKYKIYKKKKYTLYWNEPEKKWDLKED
jgi:hypothetical protein